MSATTRESSRRALVIGIDRYDRVNAHRNLRGCVRDAQAMERLLQSKLRVNHDNIRVLLGPTLASSDINPEEPLRPTRDDILGALSDIMDKSSQGDYVHVHFSGHGTRVRTVYQKRGDMHDEALLCADGSIIRDVELGVVLDEMVKKKQLVLSATLDCCHSGGAFRGDPLEAYAIRSQTTPPIRDDVDWIGLKLFDSSADAARAHGNWFWKVRDFNIIAACQPHEAAHEFTDEHGEHHGLLTRYLLQCISDLDTLSSLRTTSYQTLFRMLQARCQSRENSLLQSPVFFGKRKRSIFGMSPDLIDDMDSTTVTRVDLHRNSISLGRGIIDGVAIGDTYGLVPYAGATDSIEVRVTGVEEFQCWATATSPGAIRKVKEFWLAKAVGRAVRTSVAVLPSPGNDAIIDIVKGSYKRYITNTVPLDFKASDTADFRIGITRSTEDGSLVWAIQHRNEIVPNVPRIVASADPEDAQTMTKSLCGILTHLTKYFAFEALRPACRDISNPSWDFDIEPSRLSGMEDEAVDDDDGYDEYDEYEEDGEIKVASAVIRFRNYTGRRVFISIFNLAPDWSINQLVPEPGQEAIPIDDKEAMPELWIDIRAPGLAKTDDKPVVVKEIMKLIVSDGETPHNLSHYSLPAIGECESFASRDTGMHAEPGSWDTVHRVLEVQIPTKKGMSGKIVANYEAKLKT